MSGRLGCRAATALVRRNRLTREPESDQLQSLVVLYRLLIYAYTAFQSTVCRTRCTSLSSNRLNRGCRIDSRAAEFGTCRAAYVALRGLGPLGAFSAGRMSFYQQPNGYECGPFALKHGLALLGVFAEERRLANVAGTTTAGTDEVQLARAAAHYGCGLPTVSVTEAGAARRALTRELAGGRPVLACVDQWSHWITIGSQDGDTFVVADSAEPNVFRLMEWDELERRWGLLARDADGERYLFDLNPLTPRGTVPARARLTLADVRYLVDDGRELVRDWSDYAEDLLHLGDTTRGREDDTSIEPLARLLGRHHRTLLDRVDGRGPSHRRAATIALDRIALVAEAYDLRVPRRYARESLGLMESLAEAVVGRRWRSRTRRTAYDLSAPGSVELAERKVSHACRVIRET